MSEGGFCPCCGGQISASFDPAIAARYMWLSGHERMIFERLARTIGDWIPSESLFAHLYAGDPNGGAENQTGMKTSINRLRRKIAPYGFHIEVQLGRGNGARRLVRSKPEPGFYLPDLAPKPTDRSNVKLERS